MSIPDRDDFDQWLPTDHSYLTTVLATTVFKCILQGVLLAETHRYFSLTQASRDGLAVRVFVGGVMLLVLIHTGVATAKVYYVAIERVFWREHWLNIFDTAMNATICLSAQTFFAHRCWNVTRKSSGVTVIIILLLSAITTSTFGVVITEGISFHRSTIYAHTLRIFLYMWGVSSALLEVLIVSILFKFLWSSRTGIHGLDRVIVRLLAISLESSLPCLVFVLLLGLAVLIRSVSCNFFAYSTASLYGLSLIVSLNGRHKVQARLSEYRLQGAFLHVSELQTVGMTESQIFSDEAIAMRRASAPVGVVQAQKGRRASIMSVVKEVVRGPPPTAKLDL